MPVASHALRALAALALPLQCAVCRRADEAVCTVCRAGVESALFAGGPQGCSPSPRPPGLPEVWSSGRYEGALARLVAAYKDDGRRDLAGLLGTLLADAVRASLSGSVEGVRFLEAGRGPVHLVPVPSSRRARRVRGDAPLLALARGATRGYRRHELDVADLLYAARRVADQAGLGAAARRTNLDGALGVRRRRLPREGSVCLMVDDVMTTGATLAEAARALRAGGLRVVGAATICATQRRAEALGGVSATSR